VVILGFYDLRAAHVSQKTKRRKKFSRYSSANFEKTAGCRCLEGTDIELIIDLKFCQRFVLIMKLLIVFCCFFYFQKSFTLILQALDMYNTSFPGKMHFLVVGINFFSNSTQFWCQLRNYLDL
jgi:hypothetical protein